MAAEDFMKKAEDLAKQAGDFISEHADEAKAALKSEQAEGISDSVLGGAADLANKITGGKFADQVDDVRENLDKNIGNQ